MKAEALKLLIDLDEEVSKKMRDNDGASSPDLIHPYVLGLRYDNADHIHAENGETEIIESWDDRHSSRA